MVSLSIWAVEKEAAKAKFMLVKGMHLKQALLSPEDHPLFLGSGRRLDLKQLQNRDQ